MTVPVVDVIVPVHTDRRPIARACASVLTTATTPTRVTVVCHNVGTPEIARALGTWADEPRVRLLNLHDGVPSAAGPINAGLDAATGEFTALLGSDDKYEDGAIDSWVAVARRDGADLVIPPLRIAPGEPNRSPPTRPFRSRRLDGVKDRLAYRTVQLGLVSRDGFGGVRMTPELTTGEDILQGASLWYSGARISYASGAPGYLINQDEHDERSSMRAKPASEALRFLDAILDPGFASELTATQRESFAIKLLRTQIMDVLGASIGAGLPDSDRRAISHAIARLKDFAPRAPKALSRGEARVLAALGGESTAEHVTGLHATLTDYRRPANLIPASLRLALHREAPLRFLTATALMR